MKSVVPAAPQSRVTLAIADVCPVTPDLSLPPAYAVRPRTPPHTRPRSSRIPKPRSTLRYALRRACKRPDVGGLLLPPQKITELKQKHLGHLPPREVPEWVRAQQYPKSAAVNSLRKLSPVRSFRCFRPWWCLQLTPLSTLPSPGHPLPQQGVRLRLPRRPRGGACPPSPPTAALHVLRMMIILWPLKVICVASTQFHR